MADSSEKLKQGPRLETASAARTEQEKLAASAEVKQKAKEVIKTEVAEAAEGTLGIELSEGKVAEEAGEDKVYAPVGGKSQYSDDQIEAIRAKLLAALPPQEVMIKQIRQRLRNQEKHLTKRFTKLKKKANTHAFQLNIVVAQLRKIREFFSLLAHATYEMVKHLWLKIVHGV